MVDKIQLVYDWLVHLKETSPQLSQTGETNTQSQSLSGRKRREGVFTCFFYKHSVFQSEARICLSFS